MAEKIDILGVKVDSVTMAQAVAQVESYMDERKNVLIATANAEMIMRATHDEELKDILNDAALVVPDGAGTVWAAHHLGYEMPERVAGYDLAQELMRIAPSKKQKVFSLSRGQFFKFRKEFIKKHRSMEVIFEELFGSNSQIFADVEKDSQ